MMIYKLTAIAASVFLMASASAQTSETVAITEVAPEELPSSVLAIIAIERPSFIAEEVLKKVRDGRIYYDVEGETSDGAEVEFDILMSDEGAEIVEIQRDLAWDSLDPEVQALTLGASDGAVPVRIIESVQTDGAVIYEFFAEGQPADPSWEVRVRAGQAELLAERWIH